jgi:hypothetical protein
MAEPAWLTCTDPHELLLSLGGQADDRRLVLVACASLRRVWNFVVAAKNRRLTERLEDISPTTPLDRQAAARALVELARGVARSAELGEEKLSRQPHGLRLVVAVSDILVVTRLAKITRVKASRQKLTRVRERRMQRFLVRDIFGNPFCPVSIDPTWLSTDVRQLAASIYEERRFRDLPVLADALEDAGCARAEILDHCRSAAPHARGCWVVDSVLDRG